MGISHDRTSGDEAKSNSEEQETYPSRIKGINIRAVSRVIYSEQSLKWKCEET